MNRAKENRKDADDRAHRQSEVRTRKERLAAELRANLKKRKERQREAAAQKPADTAGSG